MIWICFIVRESLHLFSLIVGILPILLPIQVRKSDRIGTADIYSRWTFLSENRGNREPFREGGFPLTAFTRPLKARNLLFYFFLRTSATFFHSVMSLTISIAPRGLF